MEIIKIYLEDQLLIKHYVIKHLVLIKIQNMMDIKEVLLQRFISFFDEKTSGGAVKGEIMPDQQLAEDFHKPIIKKIEKRKVHSSFTDNI